MKLLNPTLLANKNRLTCKHEHEELVWTETIVSSNSSNIRLPKPFNKMGVYQYLFTLAYPVLVGEGTVFRDAVANLSIGGVSVISNITETIN